MNAYIIALIVLGACLAAIAFVLVTRRLITRSETTASAQTTGGIVTPFVGVTTNTPTDENRTVYGGSVGLTGSVVGFEVDFVTEATLTFPMTHASGKVFSAEDIRMRTELVLAGRFARIATVEQALARLSAAA